MPTAVQFTSPVPAYEPIALVAPPQAAPIISEAAHGARAISLAPLKLTSKASGFASHHSI